jgi:hypothetical protein
MLKSAPELIKMAGRDKPPTHRRTHVHAEANQLAGEAPANWR